MHFAVADYLLDIVSNSIEADAKAVAVEYLEDADSLEVFIADDGKGMNAEVLAKAKDPFYTDGLKHRKRKFGLGIPFLIQAVELTGGKFEIASEEGIGTSVAFTFNLKNIDCPPQGKLPDAILSMMLYDGDYEIRFTRKKNGNSYTVSRLELREALEDLNDGESLILAKRYIESLEDEVK